MEGRRRVAWVVGAVALVAALTSSVSGTASTNGWTSKVSPRVLRETAGGSSVSFLVVLRDQADVSGAVALPTKLAKGRFVFDTLRTHAERTQAPIRAVLDRLDVRYKAHWLVNMLTVVRGDRSLVRTMASRPDVAFVDVNDAIRSVVLPATPPRLAPRAPDAVGWNVRK